jgi:hypothetical protein
LKVAKDAGWWVESTTIATKWIANCTSSSSSFTVAKDESWVGSESTNTIIMFWNLVHSEHEGY